MSDSVHAAEGSTSVDLEPAEDIAPTFPLTYPNPKPLSNLGTRLSWSDSSNNNYTVHSHEFKKSYAFIHFTWNMLANESGAFFLVSQTVLANLNGNREAKIAMSL